MAGATEAWAARRGPVAKGITGVPEGNGVVILDVTNANQTVAIPTWMRGKRMRLTAVTANVDFIQGVSGTTLVFAQAASLSGSVITVDARSGDRIMQGTSEDFIVTTNALVTHFAWIGNTSGSLYMREADGAP